MTNSGPKRRRKRLPIAADVINAEVFGPKKIDWQRIQNAYGERLGQTHRTEIIDLVNNYFFVHELERSAPFAGDAISWLKKLRASFNQALYLMRRTADTPFLQLEAEDYARVNIVALFRKYRGGASWTWGEILTVIAQLERACRNVIRDFEAMEDGFNEGSAWKLLITRLIELAQQNKFPSQASKGGTPPPFVRFVWELQATFPPKYRNHLHSYEALAQAIIRARPSQDTNLRSKAK